MQIPSQPTYVPITPFDPFEQPPNYSAVLRADKARRVVDALKDAHVWNGFAHPLKRPAHWRHVMYRIQFTSINPSTSISTPPAANPPDQRNSEDARIVLNATLTEMFNRPGAWADKGTQKEIARLNRTFGKLERANNRLQGLQEGEDSSVGGLMRTGHDGGLFGADDGGLRFAVHDAVRDVRHYEKKVAQLGPPLMQKAVSSDVFLAALLGTALA